MDLKQFRIEVYKRLESHGHKEIDGTLYYPEAALIETMEYLYGKIRELPIEKLDERLAEVVKRAFSQIPPSAPTSSL